MHRGLTLSLVVLSLGAHASAQINLSAGAFLPKSKAVRDVFGSQAFSPGIGFSDPMRKSLAGLAFNGSANQISASGGNRFFALGMTYGYELQQGQGTDSMFYSRVGTGVAYYDYRFNSPLLGAAVSRRSFKQISTLEAGIVLNKRITLSAQYQLTPKLDGVDMSGWLVSVMFTIGK
jgi:hypothetical protein